MKRLVAPRPVVDVYWEDAFSGCGNWTQIEGAELPQCMTHTCGYLIRSDKRGVLVAQSVSADGERMADTTFVPRGMVRSLSVIRGARKAKGKGKRR